MGKKADIANKIISLNYSPEYRENDQWVIGDVYISSQMIGDEASIDGIYVYLHHEWDDDEDDEDNEQQQNAADTNALAAQMNTVLSEFFEMPVNDVMFETWDDVRGEVAIVSSEQVSEEVKKWTPILLDAR